MKPFVYVYGAYKKFEVSGLGYHWQSLTDSNSARTILVIL